MIRGFKKPNDAIGHNQHQLRIFRTKILKLNPKKKNSFFKNRKVDSDF